MKKTLIVILIVLNLFAITSCASPSKDNSGDEKSIDVSIIQLIANPAEYHGKRIKVYGVADLSYEGTSVYLCMDNWYYLTTQNAIWLRLNPEVVDDEMWYTIKGNRVSYDDAQKYNGKYVLIEGTFDMNITGHMGMFPVGIYNVTRLTDVSDINQGMNPDDYFHYIGNADDWYEGKLTEEQNP